MFFFFFTDFIILKEKHACRTDYTTNYQGKKLAPFSYKHICLLIYSGPVSEHTIKSAFLSHIPPPKSTTAIIMYTLKINMLCVCVEERGERERKRPRSRLELE